MTAYALQAVSVATVRLPARTTTPLTLRKVRGFEATDYAWQHERIVWAGTHAHTDHPRNAWRPWQPAPLSCDAQRLQRGASACMAMLAELPPLGLLPWLIGGPLPFPMDRVAPRFKAVRDALQSNDCCAFEAAALRVLGLGPGLTPSGDDFIGAIFFALVHAPRARWQGQMPALQTRIRAAAATATNLISAALLDDLMAGRSYRCLHELLAALHSQDPAQIEASARTLQRIGASSGADMLAGLLLALSTWHESF